jgi:hypothetical protein
MKIVPNWRKVSCPRCRAEPGHACFMEGHNFSLTHPERRQLADKRFGYYMPILHQHTPRRITPAMRYWSEACRTGHPDQCSGRRRSKAERGWKACENPVHTKVTTSAVTKVV